MAGLLSNPLINLGTGLMSVAGPTTHPGQASLGLGLSRGLASLQQQTQAEQEAAFRKQQMAMAKQKMAAEAAKLRAAQEAQRRQQQFISQLSPDDQAIAGIDPEGYVKGLLANRNRVTWTTIKDDAGAPLAQMSSTGEVKKDPRASTILSDAEYQQKLQLAIDRDLANPATKAALATSALQRQSVQQQMDSRAETAARERRKEKEKARRAVSSSEVGIQNVDATLGKLSELKPLITDSATGNRALVSQWNDTTPAGRLKNRLSPIMSAIVRDGMAMMRATSATGSTGFGAMNATEFKTLEDAVESLQITQSKEDVLRAVDKVEMHYRKMRENLNAALQAQRSSLMSIRGGAQPSGGLMSSPGAGPDELPPGFTLNRR